MSSWRQMLSPANVWQAAEGTNSDCIDVSSFRQALATGRRGSYCASAELSLTVHTITSLASLQALGPEFPTLLARTGFSNLPFLLHGWFMSWWQHFAVVSRFSTDSLFGLVVRNAGGELVGFVPLMLTQRPSVGPLRARALRFLGADPCISELRLPLVAHDVAGEVGRAVGRHLRLVNEWDWIHWAGLVRDSPFVTALETELSLEWGGELPGYVLRLPPTWDDFHRSRTRHVKKSLRHCYHSLERDGYEAHVAVAETPESIRAALPGFFRLHELRAQAKHMVPHPNTFRTRASQEFLEDVTTALAGSGVTKIFTLSVRDEVVACRIAFRLPDCVYLYYSGFDPAWSRYGVMTAMVAEIIKYAIAEGISSVHLSTGRDMSKTRWRPDEWLFHEAFTVRPTAFSRAALQAYNLARTSWAGGMVRQLRG